MPKGVKIYISPKRGEKKLMLSSDGHIFINTQSEKKKKKPKQVYSNPEKKNCWKQTKFVLCEADSKKPGIQVVFMLRLFFQNLYAGGQILKGTGYGLFFPFLHINVVVSVQKRKTCRNTVFFLWCKNFHMHYIPRDILLCHSSQHTEALLFLLHSHCLICKHSFRGRLGIQGLWCKMQTEQAMPQHSFQNLLFLSLSIQKQRNHSKLSSD